jgi:hypothetical protein
VAVMVMVVASMVLQAREDVQAQGISLLVLVLVLEMGLQA